MPTDKRNIRNFVIIAHIDHGKSTLADRLLEITGTVEARRMKPQYLDQLDLERERGITIKMAPVRMTYQSRQSAPVEYVLNLIDTPGHSDFTYEVSRALAAVEGAVLLVDATKGIQAQTLSNLRLARQAGLKLIGAVNKVDMPHPDIIDKHVAALARLLKVSLEEILRVSGKTGMGVPELLEKIVREVPPPGIGESPGVILPESAPLQTLIFDSVYDDHRGILAYVRVRAGEIKAGEEIMFLAGRTRLKVKEVGIFTPELQSTLRLTAGEIGYIATGLKEPSLVKIGDTLANVDSPGTALSGYREPTPVVFISFYPDGQTKFEDLKKALARLHLNDPALQFEPDANEALGRGLKVGFLGQLHFEITSDRLRREFGLEFLTSFPSIAYRVREGQTERVVKQTEDWPDKADKVYQPMIRVEIITPAEYLNPVVSLGNIFDLEIKEMENMGDNLVIIARMPLAELIRDFDDQLKSCSAGYASFSYELDGEEEARVKKLEILIAGHIQPALTRVVAEKDVEREARLTVERLKKLLPQQQFVQALQARVDNRVIARETIAALKKDVTGYLYGGDRTRKMKLWKKQKRGKERLKETNRVSVPVEVFREILKK